ncbi:ABC transporter permease [Lacticaseibacillus sp. GG6-2]
MRIHQTISKRLYWSIAIGAFLLLFIGWQSICTFGHIQAIFMPTPLSVWQAFIGGLKDGTIVANTVISVERILQGFLLAAVIGIPLGFLAGLYTPLEALILPLSEFFRYMPVPAFVPLIMIWAGIGEAAKVIVILLGVLFQIIPMVVDDVRATPQNYIDAAYTLGANQRHVIFGIVLPDSLPRLMDTLRMILGWAWTYLVVAELVAANSGLGYAVLKAQRFLKTDEVFMGILVIGVLGLITDRLFAFINGRLFPWTN